MGRCLQGDTEPIASSLQPPVSMRRLSGPQSDSIMKRVQPCVTVSLGRQRAEEVARNQLGIE